MQALRISPAEREEILHRKAVEKIIDFLKIQAYRKTPVGQLPYGLQKRVDLGRALAMEPQVLLLDEPMAGMNVEEKQDLCRFVLDVNDEFGTTCSALPPEGAAAPADWQSQIRGPCLNLTQGILLPCWT